jgi:hypothetical protein
VTAATTHNERVKIEIAIAAAKEKLNASLKALGLNPVP